MTDRKALEDAMRALDALPTTAAELAQAGNAAADMGKVIAAVQGIGRTADVGKSLDRAVRLLRSAERAGGPLKGYMLWQARMDLGLVLAEAAPMVGEAGPK